ncbi:MAG: prolyl oligopeptidase family serine peptidase [Chloroflexi bacterium]|nr:prolyl oligopeptidase family serine peptidase [Chloroflexota bacterium]
MRTKFVVIVLLLLAVLPLSAAFAQDTQSGDVDITSGGKAYQSYLAAPTSGGPYPGIVLIHSFNGLEEGYKTMVDQFAAQGFVVLAIGWQTFEKQPSDAVVQQLVEDGVAYLTARADVDPERLGLTGFCAGGRYTMLYLPQIDSFKAGVAWYGFPYNGDTQPASLVDQLKAPMLIIHGTADSASPIANIYKYAGDLTTAGADFELKVYSGKPHGFMVMNGQFQTDDESMDAFNQMITFFNRRLNASEATPAA